MIRKITAGVSPVATILGYQGENDTTQVLFPITVQWKREMGEGRAELLVRRPGEQTPYPAANTEESPEGLLWTVSRADTAIKGSGQVQLCYLIGDAVAKSAIYPVYVSESLGDAGEPPAGEAGWVEQVLRAGEAAEEATRHAPQIVDGTWHIWDAAAGAYTDTGVAATEPGPEGAKGDPGKDGGSDIRPFTVTLAPGGWGGNAQIVQDELFKAAGYFYNVYPSDLIARYGIMAQDVTVDGQMRFTCDAVPGEAVPVSINRYQYNAAPAGGGVTKEYVDQHDAETLRTAKSYADGLLGGISTLVGGGF